MLKILSNKINRKLTILDETKTIKKEYNISLYLTLLTKTDPELDNIEDLYERNTDIRN